MSTIYLIRHGITEANLAHLYCGSTDLPLSEQGAAALRAMRGKYSVSPDCRFFTSGMLRTEQTLQLLFGTVPHQSEPKLREMDFGDFEMKSYEALKDEPAYQTWLQGDNERNVAPGGESGQLMTLRVLEAFRAITAEDRDAVIVTHGGPISAIMQALFPEEGKNRYEWQRAPGCGYAISDGKYQPIPEF